MVLFETLDIVCSVSRRFLILYSFCVGDTLGTGSALIVIVTTLFSISQCLRPHTRTTYTDTRPYKTDWSWAQYVYECMHSEYK